MENNLGPKGNYVVFITLDIFDQREGQVSTAICFFSRNTSNIYICAILVLKFLKIDHRS